MAAYYTSQAYDAPSGVIWRILTDFAHWPAWFPAVSYVELSPAGAPRDGTEILAFADGRDTWTRWRIGDWRVPHRLLCEHVESNTGFSGQVQAAYLLFELTDDPEGCTLEVEIGADGYGIVGDFLVGVTLGAEVRRTLPRLVDAFSEYVVQRAAAG
ncbi:MAG TPA: SRPBCC family protein [Dehalococcoidia bacterium]|nr:SRPBCC family protein [Dehalococcoidia bacterium]